MDESLRDIRVALLEADVAFDVVKSFVARVREKAVGETVQTPPRTSTDASAESLPGRPLHQDLPRRARGPHGPGRHRRSSSSPRASCPGIMMVGLQGSGKTTTAAKLASYLLKQGRKPLLVAADIYRPAAVEQLQVLGEKLGVPVFFQGGLTPPELAVAAMPPRANRSATS